MINFKRFLLLTSLVFYFFIAHTQVVIFEEDFGNNPFNGSAFTSIPFWDEITDCDHAYAIQPNFSDLCGVFPDINAVTPTTGTVGAMNINLPSQNDAQFHLYGDNTQMLCAGNYRLSIVSLHRDNWTSSSPGNNVDLELFVSGMSMGELSLPNVNTQWSTTTLDFTLDNDFTGFTIDQLNAAHNSDFAIDNIKIELLCPVGGIIGGVPSCTDVGDQFVVEVIITTPVGPNTIDEIYTENTYFEYVSHFAVPITDQLSRLFITFETQSCSCTGEMLVFDIRIKNCPSVIWLMTRPIPCCTSDCTGITVENYELDNDCYIVNGNKAFDFDASIWLDPGVEVLDVTAVGVDGGLCPSNVTDLNFSISGGNLDISGIIEVENPDCEYADIVLQINTKFGCCEIEIPFSMPDPCDEDCLDNAATMDNVTTAQTPWGVSSNNHNVTISMNYPVGTPLTIIDNNTGAIINGTIQNTICAPFGPNKWGSWTGTPCTGFVITQEFDCSRNADKEEDTSYSFTIQIGNCRYMLIGDYCDIISGDPIFPQDGPVPGGLGLREDDESDVEFEAQVFPNPASSYESISIRSNAAIKQVQIYSTSGQLLIDQTLIESSKDYQIENLDVLDAGMYFIKVLAVDNKHTLKRVTIIK